jgi:LruC domain-containing protein
MNHLRILSASLIASLVLGAGMLASVEARASDYDGDGAPDTWDVYPKDPNLASVGYSPAKGQYGMVMFEDQWPRRFDFDFNDAVVAYNFKYRFNSQNRVHSLRATFDVLALGGTRDLGLGLRLEQADARQVRRVEVTVGWGPQPRLVTPLPQDRRMTIVITDDVRRDLFGGASGQINSSIRAPRRQGLPVSVEVEFRTPQWFSTLVAPHDLFIFRTNDVSHEIHRSYIRGTSRMDTSLFGTEDDGSNGVRSFTDTRGVPFAIVFPVVSPYPREGVGLANLYPNILQFAQSAGTVNPSFYTGPRTARAAYRDSSGRGMLTPRWPTCVNDPDC